MTIASIDIGSNTVLLLIAEYDRENQNLKSVVNHYTTPRMSEGLLPGGMIPESKINSLLKIISDYKNIAAQNNCSVILLKATNAFRISSNSQEIIRLIKERFSLETEIISGDEEARLTFLGSAYPLNLNESKTVIDIGGGSTEIIYGNLKGILLKKSFDIGVVSLTEKFMPALPPSREVISKTMEYIDETFTGLSLIILQNIKTIAVAGTPTTLSCIKQGIRIYDDSLVDSSILSIEELRNIISLLANMRKEEVLLNYGEVAKGREDLLLAGSLILQGIMQQLSVEKIIVSSKGLRYGAVIDYLIKNQWMNTAK